MKKLLDITLEDIESLGACEEGFEWFISRLEKTGKWTLSLLDVWEYDVDWAFWYLEKKGICEVEAYKYLISQVRIVNNRKEMGRTALDHAKLYDQKVVVKTLQKHSKYMYRRTGMEDLLKNILKGVKSLGVWRKVFAWVMKRPREGEEETFCPLDILEYNVRLVTRCLRYLGSWISKRFIDLISQMAGVNYQDAYGRTLLMQASDWGRVDLVKLLIENKASVCLSDVFGQTALIIASRKGHVEVVKVLLENEAKVDLQNNKGQTALMWASYEDHIDIIMMLIENRADVNILTKKGQTALMLSSRRNTEVLKVLLKNGADVDLQDKRGKTALDYAVKRELPANLKVRGFG